MAVPEAAGELHGQRVLKSTHGTLASARFLAFGNDGLGGGCSGMQAFTVAVD